jgi:IS5 family transposase
LVTRIIVDSTVQENVVAHPTDSKLLETVRVKLVEAAKA